MSECFCCGASLDDGEHGLRSTCPKCDPEQRDNADEISKLREENAALREIATGEISETYTGGFRPEHRKRYWRVGKTWFDDLDAAVKAMKEVKP